jgi:uncharacterized damage-inducible protein DinB
MKVTPAEIEKYLKWLEETPHAIAEATRGLAESRLYNKTDQNVWSIHEILAHLRSCADVWGSTIDTMLMEDRPTLPDLHPRTWSKETNYLELSFQESFQAFVSQRKKLLLTLKELSFDDWPRSAMIGGRQHTVFTQVRRMAKHEKEHRGQIESLLQSTAQR